MRISVEIDIAKDIHWVTAIDALGVVQLDRKLPNTPAAIAELVGELGALGGTVRVGLDVVGGIAGLAEAMLAESGFTLVHVSGLAVNRAARARSAARTSPTRATPAPSPTRSAPAPTCARSSPPPSSTSRYGCW